MGVALSNRLASFDFSGDGTTGFKLKSFERAGGTKVWSNSDARLWQAKVFDTTGGDTTVLATLTPPFAQFVSATKTTDATGQQIVAKWVAIPMPAGTDKLDVTLTIRLNDSEDWLRFTISAAWNGAATRFALDSIGPMCLTVDPWQRGFDNAVIPSVFGILARDPLTNLRDIARVYPAGGGGHPMALWAYYETRTDEAWMVWAENWSLEFFEATFTSDGSSMFWSCVQQQQDNILAGNNARALGSGYTFCLRPFAISQFHGWWDVGHHYRARLSAANPSWLPAVRPKRSDFSATELLPWLAVDISAQDSAHSAGLPGLTSTLIDSIRNNTSVPAQTPVLLSVEEGSYFLNRIHEAAVGDFQTQLTSAYLNKAVFPYLYNAGDFIRPLKWDHLRWYNESAGGVDSDDLRWWQTNDLINAMRQSRQGRQSGGGVDRLHQYRQSPALYYRERVYAITNWAGGSHTATVAGTPSADGFDLASLCLASLVPAAGASRMGIATIQTLGASTVKLLGDFIDGTGAVVTPLIGDSIAVWSTDALGFVEDVCCYAVQRASSVLRQYKRNFSKGQARFFKGAGFYFDTWAPGLMRIGGIDFLYSCYRDHTAWAKLDGGYVQHPLGGGSWFIQSRKDFAATHRAAIKTEQILNGTTQFSVGSCENVSEAELAEMEISFNRVSSGDLWNVGDPIANRWLTIPLFSIPHSGRSFGRGLNQELSSQALYNVFPNNDHVLHQTMGYWLAFEWPYGVTLPTLSFNETDAFPIKDFWDDTQYIINGGTISNTVRQLRDLYKQIHYAETNWLCAKGFRFGEMMAPATVNPTKTPTTVGLANGVYTNVYTSYDVIYDRAVTPRVVHAVWRADDGSVVVVLANWSDTDAGWGGIIDVATAGLGRLGSNKLKTTGIARVNYSRAPSDDVAFDPSTGMLSMASVPAFSIAVVTFDPADLGDVAGDPAGDLCSAQGFSI